MATYDSNSVVDVLKSLGKNSDLASRADLAVKYNLVKTPQEYVTLANTGQNAGQNLALINALKGVGNNGQTSMSPQSSSFNANASSSLPTQTGDVSLPGGKTTPTTGVPGSTPTPDSIGGGLNEFLSTSGLSKPSQKTDSQIRQEATSELGGDVQFGIDENGNKALQGPDGKMQRVYQDISGNWRFEGSGEIAKAANPYDAIVKAETDKNNFNMNQELKVFDAASKSRRDRLLNSFAMRGTLNADDTQVKEELTKADQEENTLRQTIIDKYNIMNSTLSAQYKEKLLADINKEIEKRMASRQQAVDNFWKEAGVALDYQAKQDEKAYKNKMAELEARKTDIDEKYKNGQLTIDQYNAESTRLKAEADAAQSYASAAKTRAEIPTTPGPEKAAEVANQIKFLVDTTAKAKALSSASGASGVSRFIGTQLKGDSEFNQLSSFTDTLKTNLMTLATDPNIKKFFGPQMSNADVRLIQSAASTLDPERMTPAQMEAELDRVAQVFQRLQGAANSGGSGAGTGGGTTRMSGPGGVFDVPNDQVENFKQNGYTQQ